MVLYNRGLEVGVDFLSIPCSPWDSFYQHHSRMGILSFVEKRKPSMTPIYFILSPSL